MIKRNLFLMIICLVLFAFPILSAEAENDVTVSLSSETASRGDDVTISVSIANNPGIMAITPKLSYDTTRLSYSGFEDSGLSGWSAENGSLAWVGDTSDYNGEVLKLKFKVLDDAPVGDASITLIFEEGDMGDASEHYYMPLVQPGTIAVKALPDPDLPVLVSISEETAEQGQEAVVSVGIANNPGIAKIKFSLSYDRDRLNYSGFENSGLNGWSLTDGNLVWAGDAIKINGEILKLKFSVLENALTGDAAVTLNFAEGDLVDAFEKSYTPQVTAGKVTVTAKTEVKPNTITIDGPDSITLEVNKFQQLFATVLPENAKDRTVSWESSDTAVAEVDQNGIVTGVGKGNTTITATANGNLNVYAQVRVTVNPAVIPNPEDTMPESVTLNVSSPVSIEIQKTLQLTAEVLPSDVADRTVTWRSDNPNVASVSGNGLVTALTAGTANIFAVANGDPTGNVYAQVRVTVNSAVIPDPEDTMPESVTLNVSSPVSLETENTLQLTAEVLPSNAADRTVTWRSDNPNVASVSGNGLVTALTAGTANIFAVANGDPTGNVYAQLQVTVNDRQDPIPERETEGLEFWRIGNNLPRVLPHTGFSAVRPQALREQPKDMNYKPLAWTLTIPSISVSADFVEVPFVDGDYPVEWLGDKVGLLEGSALPGKGAVMLAGHNHLNTMETGPFAYLMDVEEGTRIFVYGPRHTEQMYVVYANEKVSENDFSAVEKIASMFDNSITMLTCEDERLEGGYSNRRVVAARPFSN